MPRRFSQGLSAVLLAALAAGCHFAAHASGNHLRKRRVTPPAGSAAPETPATADLAHGTSVNPRDSRGRSIYASGATCYVRTGTGKYPGTWKTKDVSCPPAMDDPVWDRCTAGEIWRDKSGACVCIRGGDPPLAPIAVPCPKR